jgi:hypothetical protein
MTIMTSTHPAEWTLTDAARLLREPAHRLIYLCEKGVVQPEVQDAEGRGSSRRFSARNLLEFAVALRFRELALPASVGAAIIYLLRAFERSLSRKTSGFRLPAALRSSKAPDLRVVMSDGGKLYFTLSSGGRSVPKVYGGIDLNQISKGRRAAIERKLAHPRTPNRSASAREFGQPEGSRYARVEVSITRIAQDLRLED